MRVRGDKGALALTAGLLSVVGLVVASEAIVVAMVGVLAVVIGGGSPKVF